MGTVGREWPIPLAWEGESIFHEDIVFELGLRKVRIWLESGREAVNNLSIMSMSELRETCVYGVERWVRDMLVGLTQICEGKAPEYL